MIYYLLVLRVDILHADRYIRVSYSKLYYKISDRLWKDPPFSHRHDCWKSRIVPSIVNSFLYSFFYGARAELSKLVYLHPAPVDRLWIYPVKISVNKPLFPFSIHQIFSPYNVCHFKKMIFYGRLKIEHRPDAIFFSDFRMPLINNSKYNKISQRRVITFHISLNP
ncbi:MAG: hypothetical protein MASP_01964 [Candidatus Methanolliviera sp. GoM_asphalt]|nr:MAG: hypothetical protein MASP_01964 [Candidatus Methanolliviera sp. GoM_asphalt]